jgi:hypothetical protein
MSRRLVLRCQCMARSEIHFTCLHYRFDHSRQHLGQLVCLLLSPQREPLPQLLQTAPLHGLTKPLAHACYVAAGTAHTVHAATWLVCAQRFTEGLRKHSLLQLRERLAL